MGTLAATGAYVRVLPIVAAQWEFASGVVELFVANGPGDPAQCTAAIEILQKWLSEESVVKPVSVHRFLKTILILSSLSQYIFTKDIRNLPGPPASVTCRWLQDI